MVEIKKIILLVFILLAFSGAANALPTIDGVISPLEWDAYYLGTSVTGFFGGMSVDVYGFADGGFLYTAYVADITKPGWSSTCSLNINGNFYTKTPQTVNFPNPGLTILEMSYPRFMRTDGTGWNNLGTPAANGIEVGYVEMFSSSDADCISGVGGNHIAEFKTPLSLVTYAGNDGEINLSGQYWQYDRAATFYATIPVSLEPTKDSKVSMAQPSSNFGLGRYMMVNDKKNAVDRSYLGFNLSGIAPQSVNNAELKVYVFQTGNTVIGSIIEAWFCPNVNFNELGINWKNQPAAWKNTGTHLSKNCALADTYAVANKVNQGLPETFHTWELTSEVNSALAGNKSFTIVLKHDTELAANNKNYAQYLTRDYSEPDFRPQLMLS